MSLPMRAVLWRELRLALTALQFFTRVPVPAWVGWSAEQWRDCVRYLPVVGVLVGVVAWGVQALAGCLWPPGVAVLLSLVATLLLTGAFHEDGLADTCDGLGGGGTDRARVLAIMQDSRVGTFGVVGLMAALGLKFELLRQVPPGLFLAVSVGAHVSSRCSALWVMARLPYVREDGPSKSRGLAEGPSPLAWGVGLACLVLPLCALGQRGAWAVLASAIVAQLAVRWLRQRLGGYVGDTLGATQQFSELVFLLVCVAQVPVSSNG